METDRMDVLLSIGDFSRMSHLSVKALRHYHDIGLLEPAAVDPSSGYRSYLPSQVATAQVIRRFRDLGMPLDQVRAVVQAADVGVRNVAIVAHLDRMERQLHDTQGAVQSLRSLLSAGTEIASADAEFRSVPAIPALVIRESVASSDIGPWWLDAFQRLGASAAGSRIAGPRGATFDADFFEQAKGEVAAYLPVTDPPTRLPAGVVGEEVAAADYAVAVHQGPVTETDRTYGTLGTFVAERAIGLPGPIREIYLVTFADTLDQQEHRTEVCWPVFRTAPGA
jgi:DNA-binding transcriptional MerR regulator